MSALLENAVLTIQLGLGSWPTFRRELNRSSANPLGWPGSRHGPSPIPLSPQGQSLGRRDATTNPCGLPIPLG